MNQDEYIAMLSRDKAAIHHALSQHKFQFFGSLGCKSIPKYSPVRNLNPVRTVWTPHELYSKYMPHFFRQLAKVNHGPITYFYAIEHGYHFDRAHVQLLLGGVAQVSVASIKNIWVGMNGGRADIHPFDPKRDTGYTYKQIVGQTASASGVDHEVLWDTNMWKTGRMHNTPAQAQMFRQVQQTG